MALMSNDNYGSDHLIAPQMLDRHEILGNDAAGDYPRTGITVLDLINALCDLTDGNDAYDIMSSTGETQERSQEIFEIREKVKAFWETMDGDVRRKVL